MGKGLVILHIDGLSAHTLERALATGRMPHTRSLIESEGYEVHRYRCGIPSTTPFAQAGILYGDNSEIPSFRWWDRQRRVAVQFGAESTFKKVEDKYFGGCTPLTKDGACIAACYPGGAADNFGIAYQERTYAQEERSRSAWRVVLPYVLNPLNLTDWAGHTVVAVGRTVGDYVTSLSTGRRPAAPYVVSDALEEIFVHHLTRFAVKQAMHERFAPIYAGFYAYDETGHAFGPDDEHCVGMLKHVDHTIHDIANARGDRYELAILSDHGQVPAIQFDHLEKAHLGALVAGWMPGFRVEELKGKSYGPAAEVATGIIKLSYSGGLAHVYFADNDWRLTVDEVRARYPALLQNLIACERMALVMGRRRSGEDVFWSGGSEVRGESLRQALAPYDDPDVLIAQLSRLNSFERAGDLVFFGAFDHDRQVNFENQLGGHGSIGGEQLHPFVLAKRAWGIDTSRVHGAHELHPILCDLRDRLSA
jgi:Type I phosphodiesterase / nucleotide pyrophosphatase